MGFQPASKLRSLQRNITLCVGTVTNAMFTLCRIVFAPPRKSYRLRLLFTHNNGDFGAISVTKRSCAAPISKVERDIADTRFCDIRK